MYNKNIPQSGAPVAETTNNEIDEVIKPRKDTSDGYSTEHDNTVVMDPKHEERATSFFAQPGILAGKYDKEIDSFPDNATRLEYRGTIDKLRGLVYAPSPLIIRPNERSISRVSHPLSL